MLIIEVLQAGISQFIEKPLSVKPPEEVVDLSERLAKLQKEKGLVIAVGYMLRYSPAVEVSIHKAVAWTPALAPAPAGSPCLADLCIHPAAATQCNPLALS